LQKTRKNLFYKTSGSGHLWDHSCKTNVCKFVTYASFGWVAQGEGKDMAFMGINPKTKE
jgi:hypothetical protein